VIVSVKEFEAGKEIIRKKLMKRKALSLSEIVEHRLLPPKTTKELMTGLLPVKLKLPKPGARRI
jgi:hypothetical protein